MRPTVTTHWEIRAASGRPVCLFDNLMRARIACDRASQRVGHRLKLIEVVTTRVEREL